MAFHGCMGKQKCLAILEQHQQKEKRGEGKSSGEAPESALVVVGRQPATQQAGLVFVATHQPPAK